MKFLRSGAGAIILAITPFTCDSQQINVAKLDSFLSVLASHNMGMGSLAISQRGRVVYRRAIGYAFTGEDQQVPASANTRYRVGSVTKLFTAIMVFQLIEEKKLGLEQKLNLFFPGLPNADKITISQMLRHTSGLHDYTKNTGFEDWISKPKTHDELLSIITSKGGDFEPGSLLEYSNSNFLVLGFIVEKLCKMEYSAALKKRITIKIGLNDTYCGLGIDPSRNESASYKYSNGQWKGQVTTDPSIHGGAGSIVSTPSDLVKLMDELVAGHLIPLTDLDLMKTFVEGYGLGIFPFDHGTHAGFGHNGRIEEFYSAIHHFPEDRLTVSYCTNGVLYPRGDVLDGVMRIVLTEPFTIPFIGSVGKSSNLQQLTGKYTSNQLPFPVTCTIDGSRLRLEFGGKPMEVEPIAPNYYMHLASGSFFEFRPDSDELLVKETDNVYFMKR